MARILVIEDDVQVLGMLRRALERAGFEVIPTTDGKRALEIHRKEPADLVITDLIMPEKEGIEIIRELRRDFPDVKIIAISGGGRIGSTSYLKMAQTLGAHRTLAKPFERKEMLAAVRQLVGEA